MKNFSYLCTVSSHQASQRCSNAWGFLFYNVMENLRPFTKEYKSAAELVELLKSRGLVIADTQKAKAYIENIGYYRLSAYMHPFLTIPKQRHVFKNGTTFQQVILIYRFDKKLQMLLLNEIEFPASWKEEPLWINPQLE